MLIGVVSKALLAQTLPLLWMLAAVALAQQPQPPAWNATAGPCDADRGSQLAERAQTALSGGDPAMAATLFRQAYEVCPRQRFLLLEMAKALTSDRKFDQAIETANEFLKDDPNSFAGWLALANALFMAQRWQECGPAMDRALDLKPGDRTVLLLKGNYEYLVGEFGKAEQIFLQLLDQDPDDEDTAYMLGRIYYMDGRVEYAMAQFQRVLKLNPKAYKAWDNLGLCYDAMGNTDMAIRHFLTAIKLVEKDHPEYDWPYANLADLLLRQERHQEAYQAATIAAKRNPYSARNFFLGGKALLKLDREEDAVKWLERSAELDPDYPDPLYVLGQTYMKLGQKDKAMETLARFREAKAKTPRERR